MKKTTIKPSLLKATVKKAETALQAVIAEAYEAGYVVSCLGLTIKPSLPKATVKKAETALQAVIAEAYEAGYADGFRAATDQALARLGASLKK